MVIQEDVKSAGHTDIHLKVRQEYPVIIIITTKLSTLTLMDKLVSRFHHQKEASLVAVS